ncbi:hypothetical protein [Streptomyces sp. NPDC060322]|uniref:hypothetical protein n=1 Tax=Streptomyces sp. NPDC060322 TaxID=3347097 RepID=UPI003660B214
MNVDDVVAARIEAARVRIQAAKRRREELSAARARGLVSRHAAKLRRLRGAEDHAAVGQQPTTVGQSPKDPDPAVTETVTTAPEMEIP